MQKQQKHNSSCTFRNTMTRIRALCSVLLSLFVPGCVCGSDLTVWQTPEIINATEGQDVNISCHFTVKSAWERLKVEWWRNNKTEVKQELYNISAGNSINPESENHSSVLQIPSVRLSHSGIYTCTVWWELPTLGEKVHGPGTELRVDLMPSHATTTDHSAVTVLGASVLTSVLITVFITCVVFLIYRGRRTRPKQQSAGGAEEPSSVLYAALNIRKPQDKRNSQEVSPQPDVGGPADAEGPTDSEVLYSDVRINKKQKQGQTPLSDTT
ncbi:hypothetical protein SRHO_G00328990 [Serrasalmus rhombeus]